MENSHRSRIVNATILAVVFALGFITAIAVIDYSNSGLEHPLSALSIGHGNAPADIVKQDKIEVYSDRVVLRIENASLSSYASTGSMMPVFDSGANGLRIVPSSPDELNAGDIITFEKNSELIVHRIVEKGIDEEGVYFVTRGDNNLYSDGKIRFEDVKYLTIGIIY